MPDPQRPRALRLVSIGTATAVFAAFGVVLYYGYDYYAAPVDQRVFAPAHRIFGSAGTVGLSCGIAATVLFIANLLYVPRKSRNIQVAPGAVPGWLDWHVLSGLLGALLVVLHASFELRSTLAKTSIWALGVVLVTGLVGRYMVRFIPRTRAGEKLGMSVLEDAVLQFVDRVRPAVRHDAEALRVLQRIAEAADTRRNPAITLGENLGRLRRVRRDVKRLRRAAAVSSDSDIDELVGQLGRLYAQASLVEYASQFMDSWRALHRALALLFVVAVAAHVGVALWAGQVHF